MDKTLGEKKREPLKCPGCKKDIDVHAPALWFPRSEVHEYTQQLVIMTHMLCCGYISHTEPVATVSAYLRDVKGNARLVCNMVNQHLLAGRPQPEWLTRAWAQWEQAFVREPHRTLGEPRR